MALLFMAPTSGRAQVPQLFRQPSITCDILADAVNHYVAIGEDATIKELSSLPGLGRGYGPPDGMGVDERVGWVCRILFEPKGSEPLRQPALGGLSLPWASMPLNRWPLYPVAASGASYFVLSAGYELGGYPEPMAEYLAYCRANGRFRTVPVARPTRAQALQDLGRLRQSRAWKAIRWADHGQGFSYSFSEGDEWLALKSQAMMILLGEH